MSSAPAAEDLKPHSWLRIWAEVAGVWAIAIAWPVYTNVASGPEALTSYGVRRPDLLLLVVVVSLLGPLLITLAELPVRRVFGEPVRRWVHGTVVGALLALVLWTWLEDRGSGTVVRTLLPLAMTAGVAWLYTRTELVRNFAQILSFAAVVVVILFFLEYPIKDEILPHEGKTETGRIDSETPVVMVVFDELPLAALQKPDGRIDRRFPTFSALARDTTWYPGAVSVADQTTFAMPSIVTGEDPAPTGGAEPPASSRANHPDSVCRIAEDGGYEVHSYEPITDLCDRTWDLGTRITATIRRAVGADEPLTPVKIAPGELDKKVARWLNEPFELPYTEIGEGRREAFDRFIDELPSDPRSLSLLHSILPHIYWMYLPDGRTYPNLRAYGEEQLISPPSQAEVNRDAQQMMLQLQFTDRELGKLVRKMKENGTWEESLFIVTADHGAALTPNGSRRMIDFRNEGWIMPVPLFIKYPGQERGRVVPGTVDGRDLAPTVMSALGLEALPEMAGRDLTGLRRLSQRNRTDVVTALGGKIELDVAKAERKKVRATRYIDRVLGESFYAAGGHADLLGRPPRGLSEVPYQASDPSLYENVDLSSDQVPAYFQAALEPVASGNPGPLAFALNGRIVATARPWEYDGTWYTGVMLPPDGFRDGSNEIRVYRARTGR